MGQFDTSLPIGSKRWWEARWERVADERDRYIARCTEVNIERQRQEVRAIEAEAEVERLRDENLKLCDYVHEAAGDESALIPVSVLQRLVYVPDEAYQPHPDEPCDWSHWHQNQHSDGLRAHGLLNDTGPDQPDGSRSPSRWLAAIREDAGLVQVQLESTLRGGSENTKISSIRAALKEARRMHSDIYRFARDIHGIDHETIDRSPE